jgi:hypothetical protein
LIGAADPDDNIVREFIATELKTRALDRR